MTRFGHSFLRLCLWFCLVLPLAHALAGAAPEASLGAALAAGDHAFTLEHDGLTRRYLLHVPRSYTDSRPAPLLMALHGGGGNARFQADDAHYGLITASEKFGFIAVFPNGISPLPRGGLASWNAGTCCAQARDRNIDDVGFLRAVVADVSRRLAVDPARVYATGMSNGGMMAQRLACEAADVFRAIAPVAGTDNTLSCTPSRPVAVIEFHARDDDHVLFAGGAGPKAFKDSSKVAPFTGVEETISRWVKRNQCTAPPRVVLDKPGARCIRHGGCSEGAVVELCVTDEGGHSWPGGGATRIVKTRPSSALSADELMWEFFAGLPPK
ncbi:MAG: prolyl oligopeptidase family serine peptidase [Paucibacter sp.]|nr:prolyl oligopeptidase family serine peptidase [Roseateles sp.]